MTEMTLAMFQQRVERWVRHCFGDDAAIDPVERRNRFMEEALELFQACGGPKEDAHTLTEYVFGRPKGTKEQEVGGVALTLAALCTANNIALHGAALAELQSAWARVEKIRIKQMAKPVGSPLPGPMSSK